MTPYLILQPGNNSRRAQTSRAGGNVPDPHSPKCQVLTRSVGESGVRMAAAADGFGLHEPRWVFWQKARVTAGRA